MGDSKENKGNGKRVVLTVVESIGKIFSQDSIRNNILGYKKNGKPRTVYDVYKKQTRVSKGKKGESKPDKFSLYVDPASRKKKGKKKDKKRWKGY